jgi:Fe-S-cluster containining protein
MKPEDIKETNCDCDQCRSACENRPGWFLPDGVMAAVEFLGFKTLAEAVKARKLAIDWWVENPDDILVIAPNVTRNDSDFYPSWPSGRCVFLNEQGRCDIYPVRPFECKVALPHGDVPQSLHSHVAFSWRSDEMISRSGLNLKDAEGMMTSRLEGMLTMLEMFK